MNIKGKRGFMLIELVVVIAVIAILAAILIPSSSGIVQDASEQATLTEAKDRYVCFLKEHAADTDFSKPILLQVNGDTYVVTRGEVKKADPSQDAEIENLLANATPCTEHESCAAIHAVKKEHTQEAPEDTEVTPSDPPEAPLPDPSERAREIYTEFAKLHPLLPIINEVFVKVEGRFYKISLENAQIAAVAPRTEGDSEPENYSCDHGDNGVCGYVYL